METVEIREKLNSIFQDVFDDESIQINDTTNAESIEDWDSLMHINLIVATEKEFEVKFALGETQKLQNVGEMIVLINKKMNENE